MDTWLCNLYFSMELREPLTNPYTTQLEIDNEAHNKIAQILSLEQDKEIEHEGVKYQQVDQPNSSNATPEQEQAIQLQRPESAMVRENRIAELLKEEDSEADYDNPQGGAKEYKKLEKPEDFDPYNFHIPHIELKSRMVFTQQVKYIMDEILGDLGLRNCMSFDFLLSFILVILSVWFRAYAHPFGSWLLLKMSSIPVTSFELKL